MQRILVGLDGSPRAKEVLDASVALARKTGGQILLFRAVGLPHEVPHEAYSLSPDSVADLLRNTAEQYLNEVVAAVPEAMRLGTRVAIGVPWQAICNAARETRADLIVIGSHGYSGIDRLIGTTAGRVVNHAECSVLVVRHLSI